MLIMLQKPNATDVGSYNFWKTHKRNVMNGEKGIKIIAPLIKKSKVLINEKESNEPVGKNPVEEIKQIEKEIQQIIGFKLTSVFDISQTQGEPIPKILEKLTGNSDIAEKIINGITILSEIPILYKDLPGTINGYCTPNEIGIKITLVKI